ncbi:MAG TPA: hypothetical protein VHI95_13680 [Acidimicrobiales bacterium]|nr:hypothetical protein [Acidimicrobiales bacterium]
MTDTSPARRTGVSGGARPAVVAAAVGSAVAGLVHAAAAGTHQGDSLLVWMFSACAAAQLGWGWAVAIAPRPRRTLLLTGLVINGGAVLVWAASRTVGIGFIDSLKVPEEVGTQDLTAALFAALSVAAIVCLLVRPAVRVVFPPSWAGGVAVCAFLLAMPALAAGHSHSSTAHDHVTTGDETAASHSHGEATAADAHAHTADTTSTSDDGHAHTEDTTSTSADAHDHTADTTSTSTSADAHDHDTVAAAASSVHDHASESATTDTEPAGPHDHSTTTTLPHDHDPDPTTDPPITSLDDPRLTPEQVQAAIDLIVATVNGLPASLSEADVVGAGYQSIGDGVQPGEYEHFVKWSYLSDGYELDAGHIESIVMKINADGTKRVVAAMYSLTFGDTMADAPDIAGGLTIWHDHDDMCFSGDQFVGLTSSGACTTGTLRDTPPMLHVWIEENPCGPFAVIDNQPHECTDGHHH